MDWPLCHGLAVRSEMLRLGKQLADLVREKLAFVYPDEPGDDTRPDAYIWARIVRCPHCEGLVPLSPNWRLAPDGTGVRHDPQNGTGPGDASRRVQFTIVIKASDQSPGTVSGGDATCPFNDCQRLIDGDHIKAEAQAGRMGDQLYTVVYKKRTITGYTKAGKVKEKWIRAYRSPRAEDDLSGVLADVLAEKLPEWEALDMVPTEAVASGHNTEEPIRYGMKFWRDMFSSRQLLGHATSVEIFRELIEEEKATGRWSDITAAAFCYFSFSLDKMLNYNSRMSVWMSTREVIANTFNRHDFAFCYAEIAPLMRAHTPVAGLVSRHTRDLLREYHRRGLISTPIASREVVDKFLDMTPAEEDAYRALEDYISSTYNNASEDKRSAIGFVMTIYRKRLASSFYALRRTLEERLAFVSGQASLPFDALRTAEDADAADAAEDDEDAGIENDEADEERVAEQKQAALQLEEAGAIEALLARVRRLPGDTKARRLAEVLRALQQGSYHAMDDALLPAFPQAIVFTQYTDTLDYLRDVLKLEGLSILCYSGRGGEWLQPGGVWKKLSRKKPNAAFAGRRRRCCYAPMRRRKGSTSSSAAH